MLSFGVHRLGETQSKWKEAPHGICES